MDSATPNPQAQVANLQARVDFLQAALNIAQQQTKRAQDAEINTAAPLITQLTGLRAQFQEAQKRIAELTQAAKAKGPAENGKKEKATGVMDWNEALFALAFIKAVFGCVVVPFVQFIVFTIRT